MTNYSLNNLASKIEFDPIDFAVLLELFLDTTDLDLNDISSAIDTSAKNLISGSVHNIKGASLNLGLDKITELMEKISKLNKSGLYSDIEEIVSKTRLEISRLREILEKN